MVVVNITISFSSPFAPIWIFFMSFGASFKKRSKRYPFNVTKSSGWRRSPMSRSPASTLCNLKGSSFPFSSLTKISIFSFFTLPAQPCMTMRSFNPSDANTQAVTFPCNAFISYYLNISFLCIWIFEVYVIIQSV